jgi:hypothetical protein
MFYRHQSRALINNHSINGEVFGHERSKEQVCRPQIIGNHSNHDLYQHGIRGASSEALLTA